MADNSGPRTYPLYRYAPSLAAAIILCILFCLATLLHLWQMIRKRVWFLTPFVIGGFCKLCFRPAAKIVTDVPCAIGEFVGYACRAVSAQSPPGHYRLMPFVIQNSYILIAPALFAATIYMILGGLSC
jgi:hypothetical protein